MIIYKWIALQKYKTLRNRVTNQIRNEVRAANGKRVDEATNESEYWKVVNDITKAKCGYPIQLELNKKVPTETDRILRPSSSRIWNQDARSEAAKESFSRNAAKIWNNAPLIIKNAINIKSAKKEKTRHCKTLPI